MSRDIEFLSKCKRSGITPIHCRLGGRRSASPTTRKFLRDTEKKLLNRSIVKNYTKRFKQRQIKKKQDSVLEENLSLNDYMNIQRLTEKRNSKILDRKTSHLSTKFQKLLKTKVTQSTTISDEERKEHQQRTLLNFTDKEIPNEFIPLLSKGLNFKIATKKLPVLDFVCGIEEAAKKLSSKSAANEFRFDCKKIIKNGKKNKSTNIEQALCNGLKEWLKSNELTLIENDKGRATCIIENKKVEELIDKELSNRERYKPMMEDNIENVKTSVNKELNNLHKEKKITKELLNKLKQITPATPSGRPTLKAHKNPLKVRLIINTQGSAFYKVAKFVSNELKPLTTNAKSFIKDTGDFVDKLKDITLNDDEKLISFDIADMYPSLPKEEVIREVERRINQHTFKTKLNKEALVRLARISIQFMSFRMGNKYYDQADGLFIGSPASPAYAELFIQRIEEHHVYQMIHAPRIWLRKVDDTFTISQHAINDTLTELNTINKAVNFTAEEEINREIPFLDCVVERTADNKLKTKVFKKKTHTGQYSNFNSNQPYHVKVSTIKTLTRRAKIVCKNEEDLHKELKYIEKTMQLNDFPSNVVKRTIKESLKPNEKKKVRDDDEENMIKMYLPYEKGVSEKIAAKCKRYNVKLVNTKGKTLGNALKVKTNVDGDMSGVVYKVNCKDCEKYYIGETGRTIETRMKEHKQGANGEQEKVSGLSQHLKQTNHEAEFDDVKVLFRERNFRMRKFKEALAIKEHKANLLNKKEEIKLLSNVWENLL